MRLANRSITALLAGAGILMLAGCGGKEEPEAAPVVRPVKTVVVGMGASGRLTFPGTTQAADRAELSFRVAGPLIKLPINEGDEVRRGQLIGRIDPVDFEIAVAEAQAAYDKAEADHQRHQRLYEKEAVPKAELELKRAERDVAMARLDQAETDLGYTHLKAPFPGYIGKKYVENYEMVLRRQAIVTLHDVKIIEIVIDVPEYLMTSVRDDVHVRRTATFDAAPGEEFDVQFAEASAQADPVTQTFQVTLSLPQPKTLRVLPGMTAHLVFDADVEEAAVFTVPAYAVFADDQGRSTVWLVDEGEKTVHRRQVEIGPVTGDASIVIKSGLQVGDRVAVAAVHHLQEGEKVRPVDPR